MRIGVFVGSAPFLEYLDQVQPVTMDDAGVDADVDADKWGQPSDQVFALQGSAHTLFFMRRHGADHEYAPHKINYRANFWRMYSHQIDGVIGCYTVRGIDPNFAVGDFVFADQIIDYTWGRAHTFDDELRHVEFSYPYNASLKEILLSHGKKVGITTHDSGVYGCTQGPRLETAAEIRKFAKDGCSMIGMTGMPEASLCRELGLPMVSISVVVNPAAGLNDKPIDMASLHKVNQRGARDLAHLLQEFANQTD